jgi:heterotetrameric sarcosine oxidase delta subunit
MLLIPCPHCGDRDESEFDYGGPALHFPELSADIAEWYRTVHEPEIDESELDELWFHAAGCGCWIKTRRNIRTHTFQDSTQDKRRQT